MTPAPPDRLLALDVLRGLAVAGMILVVSPGDWNAAYPQLRHAAWNGWTLADMVFPTFLFCTGVALGLSFPKDLRARDARRSLALRVVRRSLALVLLGLLLEATYVWAISLGAPYPGGPGLAHLRIPGVLQRIGLCYALAAALLFSTARRDAAGLSRLKVAAVGVAIAAGLAAYGALLLLAPGPGVPAGRLDPERALPALLDRAVFTPAHMWPLGVGVEGGRVVYDPEGLLSSLPATADVLFGALAAHLLRRRPARAAWAIAGGGAVLVAAGLLLDPVLPINKRLWTSSFALFSSGVAALALAALIPGLKAAVVRGAAWPFRVLGGNAVLAFILSTAFSRLAGFALIPRRGGWEAPQAWGDRLALAVLPDPRLASFACAVGIVALVTLALAPLHRRAIHFRL